LSDTEFDNSFELGEKKEKLKKKERKMMVNENGELEGGY
jgi:hypothetical protein